MDLYEPVVLRGSEVSVMPIESADGLGDPQVAWVVSGADRRIIHYGDAMWHGHWWKLRLALGPFDVAFLPINGAVVQSRLPPSGLPASMTPEQACVGAQILGARLLCPINYGDNNPPAYVEFPKVEAAVVAEAKRRGVALALLKPGEWVPLPPKATAAACS